MSLGLQAPSGSVSDPTDQTALPTWFAWFNRVGDTLLALTTSGTTAQRPTKGLWIGRFYFDKTLGKPIWLKSNAPNVWVDGAGTVS